MIVEEKMKRIAYKTILVLMMFSRLASAAGRPVRVLFAHGYGADRRQGIHYRDRGMFDNCRVEVFDFPDSWFVGEYDKTDFAQAGELAVLEGAYNRLAKVYDKIVAGVSRGAMCVLSAHVPGARGRIAESPAASLKDIIDHKCKQFGFGWVPCLGRFIHRWIIHPLMFKSYNPTGPKPIDRVRNIPKNQPVLICYTTQDSLIPASSSVKLAEELVRSGHKAVYLWETNHGRHAGIASSRAGREFVNVVNAFLKRCGALPKTYDCGGADRVLAKCKLNSLEEVTALRRKLEWCNWKKYWGRNLGVFVAIVGGAWFLGKKSLFR